MLNRYDLFDIVKWMREQDEPPEGGEAPPQDQNQAPSQPSESPDDKIKKSSDDSRAEDVEGFRKKHGDAIYRLVQAYRAYRKAHERNDPSSLVMDPRADERYGFNTQNQDLQSKWGNSGIDAPYLAAFDTAITGLEGDLHLRFLAALKGGRAGGGGRFMFRSPGDAQEYADTVGQLRDDLAFEVQRGDPRVVSYTSQPKQEDPAQPATEPNQ